MKIGILTYQWAINYGAVLQAYALQEKVRELSGGTVDIINFAPPSLVEFYGLNPLRRGLTLKNRLGLVLCFPKKAKKHRLFQKFLSESLCLSPVTQNVQELAAQLADYDVVISGSDQVWNADICREHLPAYLFDFKLPGVKKAAYAASFGANWIKERHRDITARALKDFAEISTREQQGVSLVEELTGRRVEHVVDPVLLLTADQWRSFSMSKRRFPPYIFLYALQKTPRFLKHLAHIQNALGLPVVDVLPSHDKRKSSRTADYNLYDVCPREWVGLLDGAQYVVTDSFHCSTFSVILEKSFVSLRHSKTDDRVHSLLNLAGLSGRQLFVEDDVADYEEFFSRAPKGDILGLEAEQARSEAYLRRVLKV